jgi:hypothetical protein
MKELRLLFGVYITIIVLLIACTKHIDVVAPEINLGKESTGMSFTSSPVINNGKVTFSVQVTPDAKYSVQIVDISGDVKVKQGLTATKSIETISMPLDKFGAFDVVVLDIKGNEIKQPIIKKI